MENRKNIIAVVVAVLIISLAVIVFSLYFNKSGKEKSLGQQQTGDLKSADSVQAQSDEMDRQREEALRISGTQEVPQITEEQIQAQSDEMDAVRERRVQVVDQQAQVVVPQLTSETVQQQSEEMDALRDKKL